MRYSSASQSQLYAASWFSRTAIEPVRKPRRSRSERADHRPAARRGLFGGNGAITPQSKSVSS
jgi:hypothetical protein